MNLHTRSGAGEALQVDPSSLMDDPHGKFASLRPYAPVIEIGPKHYLVLRYDDVMAMLTDPRVAQIEGETMVKLNEVPDGYVHNMLKDLLLFSNGEDHREKRKLFAKSFCFANVRASRSRLRRTANRLVAELPRGQEFDFCELMAARIPAEMIASILGLPPSEMDFFIPRVRELAQVIAPVYPHERHEQIELAGRDIVTYVADHLNHRLFEPKEDLLTRVLVDWAQDEPVTFDCLVHQIVSLIVAGIDTTCSMFGRLVSLVLEHEEQWEAIKQNDALIPGAVSEALRFDPSVGSVLRFTTAPVRIGETTVPEGSLLRCGTMSALRDPSIYTDPDRFDIRRTDHSRMHISYGMGPHRCLGEILSRIEMEEGLAALAMGAPDIKLIAPGRLVGFAGVRRLSAMRVWIE